MIVAYMAIKVILSGICLVAIRKGALERSLSSMSRHMPGEIFVMYKSLTTFIALVWSIEIASVVALVMPEFGSQYKYLVLNLMPIASIPSHGFLGRLSSAVYAQQPSKELLRGEKIW